MRRFFLNQALILSFFLVIVPAAPASASGLHQVVQVLDGNLVVVKYEGSEEVIRLLGVEIPRTVPGEDKPVKSYQEKAKQFSVKMLAGRMVRLDLEPDQKSDKYGSLLAYVYLPPGQIEKPLRCLVGTSYGEIDFNGSLISCGYARTDPRSSFQRRNLYLKFESDARFSNRGLWKGGRHYEEDDSSSPARETTGDADSFVASRKSDRFHRPDCRYARKIKPDDLIKFRAREEAREAGYLPCALCKP